MVFELTRQVPTGAVALVTAILASLTPPAAGSELATAVFHPGGVDLEPHVAYSRAVLTFTGNEVDVRRELESGAPISIGVFDDDGQLLPDGIYNWELQLVPQQDVAGELREQTRRLGEAGDAWRPVTGAFTVVAGFVASPELSEPGALREGSTLDLHPGMTTHVVGSGGQRVPIDDDVAVGTRQDVEEAVATASAAAGTPLPESQPTAHPERLDAAALKLGHSLEPQLEPLEDLESPVGSARPTERSIDPEGKNGRPRSHEKSR